MRLAASSLTLLVFSLAACQTLTEDPPASIDASPLGTGLRIADVQDPTSTYYMQAIAAAQASIAHGTENTGVGVRISSAVVSWIDTFDETKDGKSVGAVYVQDIGSVAPYSGTNLYEPSYVPASIRLLPGDVLDLNGPYEEQASVGSATFSAPDTLPSLDKPVATFDYEFTSPTPVVIQLSDIDQSNYATGRKWEGMLVTLNDITVGPGVNDNNRVTYILGQGDASVDNNAAAISNELYDLGSTDYPTGTHFSSVTGIVTWFYSYQVAPRSAADLKQ
jgi:hypothetical protein